MDVLVCGAGVAGAALAYWLRHHGFIPTVVERAPGVRASGRSSTSSTTRSPPWSRPTPTCGSPSTAAGRAASTWWPALTGCSRAPARWPSGRRSASSGTWASTRRSSAYPVGSAPRPAARSTAYRARRPGCSPPATAPEPVRCCTSPPGRWPTTATTPGSTSASWPSGSPAEAGWSGACWRRCGRRRICSSRRTPRSRWTAGSPAGWCWSGTPVTVRRRPRVATPPRR
ncbi:FAD-dependent oxidoreductase [Nonomuraea sp. NPDC004580]|uniref:FAD-dependent oxidoreductase n=1 Tax=Nonomuraea sp. NPDC004580 TaxID=3154552 RepID=UPI0033A8CFA0